MDRLSELASLIDRYAPEHGSAPTALPRLHLARMEKPTDPMHILQEPALCIAAQGRKQMILGDRLYSYEPSHYLLVSADLPVVGCVMEASPEKPYLGMRLDLSPAALAALMLEMDGNGKASDAPGSGILMSPLTEPLLDAAIRLVRLLDDPASAPILAPLIEREIHYRLLIGDQAIRLRQIALADSKFNQVNRAISWIKQNYARPFRIETVAAEARMSPSSLHEHFKAVTAMSPLQYQKQIRLQEARRLIVGEAVDAATAAHRVGYDSPSQFSREYNRLFGAPPIRDAERLRAAPEASAAV
ncbi:AraC-type transcriptional regulator domain protein [Parvibaculum lavamentivorans DS-1]|uniref:AraC-type transcriptional regulator domain protein n=1 Tax=Parvibaculum lavamentivorans (strain DS-1 / DSM 13023 / NCIMB 13966) TaxID=402881 RepID=A7HXI9_PARL1|nr:AraC family transcriptional regulator [Parvibaculum lavamentivorans]ABS64622.1 AraC-type transcriptional regulator domain protein [Parvibaculum lavamentivorans DS-1]